MSSVTLNLSEKEFDAVKMMREIREKLSKKYWNHPEILKKDMEVIRKKYMAESVVSEK